MDYIYIVKENNEMEKMEVVTIYNMSNSEYNYIIYKSLVNNNCYIGKYIGTDVSDLDTNLTVEELNYAKGIYDALVGDNNESVNR